MQRRVRPAPILLVLLVLCSASRVQQEIEGDNVGQRYIQRHIHMTLKNTVGALCVCDCSLLFMRGFSLCLGLKNPFLCMDINLNQQINFEEKEEKVMRRDHIF